MGNLDWSILAPTALGGLLAIGGGFLGQWWNSRQTALRERAVWARDLGYEAHLSFIETYQRLFKMVSDRGPAR